MIALLAQFQMNEAHTNAIFSREQLLNELKNENEAAAIERTHLDNLLNLAK